MRAVVIARDGSGDGFLGAGGEVPLLPLADRPFLDHVCESLVHAGIRIVDWVVSPEMGSVLQFLGDGTRWGVTFRYHTMSSASRGYEMVGRLLAGGTTGEKVVLGRADSLVNVPGLVRYAALNERVPVVLAGAVRAEGAGPDSEWRWSGWAVVSGEGARPPMVSDEPQLEKHFARHGNGCLRMAAHPLDLSTVGGYLRANRVALRDLEPPISRCAGEWPSGICVAPSARVHATATLIAPVFIGARSEIAAGAVVGPNVTVGSGCVVERGVVASDAVVLPDTYVGEGMRFDHAVVVRDRLVVQSETGPILVTSGITVASLTDHLPARLVAAAARFRGRVAAWGARVRGAGQSLRRFVWEELEGADATGQGPEPVPIPTATD